MGNFLCLCWKRNKIINYKKYHINKNYFDIKSKVNIYTITECYDKNNIDLIRSIIFYH